MFVSRLGRGILKFLDRNGPEKIGPICDRFNNRHGWEEVHEEISALKNEDLVGTDGMKYVVTDKGSRYLENEVKESV